MGMDAGRNGHAEAKLLSHVRKLLSQYKDLDSRLRVLDLGCGQRCPAVSVFTGWGWETTGIDVCYVGLDHRPSKYLGIVRTEGWGRMARAMAREIIGDPRYRKALFGDLNLKKPGKHLDIRLMSATEMEFPDNTFDIVYSMAVFEHIDDPAPAVKEINRVLKPDGVGYVGLSLWPSLVGGHRPEWRHPNEYQPKDVSPWDHLRANLYPTPVYCNKFRERDFRRIFEEQTRILEWMDVPREGESLITPEILAELPDYTADELTKRNVTAIVRKKSQ